MDVLKLISTGSGKMAEVPSISTSVCLNKYCGEHAKIDGAICKYCFAMRYAKMRESLRKKLARNHEILTTRILEDKEVPIVNAQIFRFESFGDLNNTTQLRNYYKIARMNPNVKFALWTKNPSIIVECDEQMPLNITLVMSSLFVNVSITQQQIDRFLKKCDGKVDACQVKVFTVYNKKYATDNNIDINCGARSCFSCQKCYHKDNGQVFIKELIK